ncbi:ABC transporter ATP-binding protein [Pelagibacteraceae bacterium]|nr:ABC transporter ATP-binding protein [Pelagibacteraceae bacterium]
MNIKNKNNNISAINVLKKINLNLDRKRKRDIKLVFFLSILSSIAESVSIAMLIPFISFFVNPNDYIFNNLFVGIFHYFNIISEKEILAATAIGFILIVLLSGLVKIRYIKSSNNLTDNITSDFRIRIFRFLLNQNLNFHFIHGSNQIMSNLAQKAGAFTALVFSSLSILNSILISLAVVIVLTINEPIYTPLILFLILLFFFIIFKIKSVTVLKKGQSVNLNQNFIIDIFQNAVGYLPEIIIYNLRKFFLTTMKNVSEEIARSSSITRTIGMTPRVYLETSVIILVIMVLFFSDLSERSIESNIAYLAILAFGAQKILPLINNVYNLSIKFKSSIPTVSSYFELLEKGNSNEIKDQEYKTLDFKNVIKLDNISFRYNKDLPNILSKYNFNITKGEKIAIKGQTGSGKSTLVNIITGLLKPTEGNIFIDNTLINSENLNQWQKNIAIVPQIVFLNDASILENIAIALDINSIDKEKVKWSAKLAKIDTFIESLPSSYDEKVGERGIRLSGGQKQRLGIARALYRDAKVIILDEPTNALDSETEGLVMDSITKLSKDITLIMISHSDASLKYFDKIIDLDKKD